MAFDARAVLVMIASPSDTLAERSAINEVVAQWNADHAQDVKVVLLPVMWERNAVSEVGASPQDSINRQLVERSDILIGAFWTRLGTATQSSISGTVEEIEQFIDAGKPAGLFFSNRPAEPGTLDPGQLSALQDFKSAMRNRSLYFEYGELSELRTRVASFLTRTIRDREGAHIEPPEQEAILKTASLAAQVISEIRNGSFTVRDWYIVVVNNGSGSARNVNLELESANSSEQPWRVLDPDPIDYLAANSEFRFHLVISMGSARRCNATFRWTNEDGSEGLTRQTLTL